MAGPVRRHREDGGKVVNYPRNLEEAVMFWWKRGFCYEDQNCAYPVIEKEVPLRKKYQRQCELKNGHGPEGLYCKRHAKEVEKGP